jgi:hypothetical protein
MAALFTRTNGPAARGDSSCSAAAASSLPVPLSPVMSTRASGGRDLLDEGADPLHGPAAADQPRARGELGGERPRKFAGAPQLDGTGHREQHRLGGERLLDEVERADRVACTASASVARPLIMTTGRSAWCGLHGQDLEAAGAGQRQVEEHDVGLLRDSRETILAGGRRPGRVALRIQQAGQQPPDVGLVVDDQDSGHGGSAAGHDLGPLRRCRLPGSGRLLRHVMRADGPYSRRTGCDAPCLAGVSAAVHSLA